MALDHIDCACVIHDTKYDMGYVDRLYNMLRRNLSRPVKLHVWTESHRSLNPEYIRHDLIEWKDVAGPRKSWWYKIQMFDPRHGISGPLLYFDLDVVIVDNIDWMLDLPQDKFCAVKDFRYLWKANRQEINSSIMFWQPQRYHWIWEEFTNRTRQAVIKKHAGDQDYLNEVIPKDQILLLPEHRIQSYRWQVLNGGWNNQSRSYHRPGTGCNITAGTSVVVFHGDPKPGTVQDAVIRAHWG